jgi:decaprenyl-diphosphate synthase subunit 1
VCQDKTNNVDPYSLVQNDLDTLADDIKQELQTKTGELHNVSGYHFDGAGKYFRPMIVLLMAKACNLHSVVACGSNSLLPSQRRIAMIAEMIHTSSLMHDDVIDVSDTRRGRPTVQKSWGQRKAILAGDYVLAVASVLIAKIGNEEVVKVLSQVLEDLVAGEFMQLGSKEEETERFNHYLKKTYKKTASLIANSCKAVSILGNCADHVIEIAFEYGRNVGIAFQLVDDLLDFVSCEVIMGKPAAADLKLGLATAPVLYAAHQFDEINSMIMRRFTQPGDVERTRELVAKSDGIRHTRFLAEQHCRESIRNILQLCPSVERDALVNVTRRVLNRLK